MRKFLNIITENEDNKRVSKLCKILLCLLDKKEPICVQIEKYLDFFHFFFIKYNKKILTPSTMPPFSVLFH